MKITFCTDDVAGWLFRREYKTLNNVLKYGKHYLNEYKKHNFKDKQNTKLEVYINKDCIYYTKPDFIIN